jgi:chloramphenicol-sensitive protein RarD
MATAGPEDTGVTAARPINEDSLVGFLYALAAYLMWGVLPFYMKAVGHIPALEVVAHRVIWSVPIAGAVLLIRGRTADIRAAFGNPAMLAMAALTASIITINWLIYVWSIGAGRTVEAAFGYYINPLLSVALGAVLLKEKLKGGQIAAILLAVVAVGILAYEAGGVPWVSISLAVSWAFYAYFRKTLPVGPNQGFFLEVLILSVPALGYLIWLQMHGGGHFLAANPSDFWLLLAAGVVTAAPLMIYANGAKLLKLSTIGIMQYIAPTIIFFTAVFIFHEPFGMTRLIAFLLIWCALVIYSVTMFRGRGK